MWAVNGENLKMCEGDFGLALPITIGGVTFASTDKVKLTIKDAVNGNEVLSKEFSEITDNTIILEFTAEESALLSVGTYYYVLDWYQNNRFLCNIIPAAKLAVGDKA